MRVLQWIVERCHGRAHGIETPLGLEPTYGDLNWTGLDFGQKHFARVMKVDHDMWTRELTAHDELFAKLGAKRPAALAAERARLGERLGI
jgi:phosphoenolpyruvate carboxykinase (GTP)